MITLPIINHQYLRYASSNINWLPMDTEELYADNLKKSYNELKKYKWLNCNISYKFNQHGFRSDEFSQDPGIIFLGCSFTCGIGMHYENLWTSIVSKKLNLKQYNLGIGASSSDTSFRLGKHYISTLKPKIVIFLQPQKHRLEVLEHDYFHNLLPTAERIELSRFYRAWVSNDENANLNFEKNKYAIEFLCLQNNIKFYRFIIEDYPITDRARDLAHPGVMSNSAFSQIVLDKIII